MIVLVILVISRNATFSQDQRVIDSLHHVLQQSSGASRFDPLYELVFEHINRDNELALNYILQADKAAMLSKDTLKMVKAKRVQGSILKMLGKPREALSVVLPLVETTYLKRFPKEYLGVLNLVGICYMHTSEFDKALKYQYREYEEAERNNQGSNLSIALGNIGLTYYKLKNYRKAAVFMKQSLAFENTAKVNYPMLINISLCYTHLHSLDSAQIFLDRAIDFCRNGCPRQWMWHSKYASGLIRYEMKEYRQAEADFLQSFDLAKNGGDVRIQLDNIYLLSKIYVQNGDRRKAEKYLEIGESLIQTGIPFNMEAMKVYGQLAELYLAVRNFEKASMYQGRYTNLKDSIYNESVTNSLIDIESRHHERMNESRIAEQNEIILLNEQIIDRQEKLNILSAIVVILIIAFIIFLFNRYRKQHELNALLDRKVHERTSELEVSRRELLRAMRLRDQQVMRTASLISEKINTLKGLSNTVREEVSDPVVYAYVDRIHNTAKQIDTYLRLLLNDSKEITTR